ncbi:hypothetical protein ONZ45_g11736 [Pleurotus djamor]|nr:hypothetical protein ONZ45_g11736 [Pleurotus djamor]
MILQNLLRESAVIFAFVLYVLSSPITFDDDLDVRVDQDALDTPQVPELTFPIGYGNDGAATLDWRSPSSKAKFSKAKAGISSKTRKTPKSSNQNQNEAPKKQSSKELTTRPPKKPATPPPSRDWRKSPSPIEGTRAEDGPSSRAS